MIQKSRFLQLLLENLDYPADLGRPLIPYFQLILLDPQVHSSPGHQCHPVNLLARWLQAVLVNLADHWDQPDPEVLCFQSIPVVQCIQSIQWHHWGQNHRELPVNLMPRLHRLVQQVRLDLAVPAVQMIQGHPSSLVFQ